MLVKAVDARQAHHITFKGDGSESCVEHWEHHHPVYEKLLAKYESRRFNIDKYPMRFVFTMVNDRLLITAWTDYHITEEYDELTSVFPSKLVNHDEICIAPRQRKYVDILIEQGLISEKYTEFEIGRFYTKAKGREIRCYKLIV